MAKGAKVVLAARGKVELDKVAAELGEDALAVVTDVTKRGDVEHLCRAALDRFGRIDVWVNNAGRGISRAIAELTDDDMDAMWRDNMKSVLYGIQAVLPHFKSRNQGQIINLSGGLSRAPLAPARAAYGAVKSAVNMLSASLRVELGATHPGIHVTVVLPGVVATDFGRHALGGGVDNRNIPGAQSVEAAVEAIVDVIENPKLEAYTSPFIAETVARYQRDPEAFEAELARAEGEAPTLERRFLSANPRVLGIDGSRRVAPPAHHEARRMGTHLRSRGFPPLSHSRALARRARALGQSTRSRGARDPARGRATGHGALLRRVSAQSRSSVPPA